jgi:hypothetical protein
MYRESPAVNFCTIEPEQVQKFNRKVQGAPLARREGTMAHVVDRINW